MLKKAQNSPKNNRLVTTHDQRLINHHPQKIYHSKGASGDVLERLEEIAP
jgi:hypothetical protein